MMMSAETALVLKFLLAGLLGWSALSKVGRIDVFARGEVSRATHWCRRGLCGRLQSSSLRERP